MASTRTGKFPFEMRPSFITHESLRGMYDPALKSDCRCGTDCETCQFGYCCDMSPWTALGSAEAWGEEYLTPQGLADGDIANPRGQFVPFDDLIACDIYGRPLGERETDEEGEFLDSSTEDENEWPISAML